MNTLTQFAALVLVAAGLLACSKKPAEPPPAPKTADAPAEATAAAPASAVTVTGATLGSAIGPDKKITTATESFVKGDTIHVSIDMTGTTGATVQAKWTYFDKDAKSTTTIAEMSQGVVPASQPTIDFSVSNPDGWPPGDYQVEILVNDQVVQTKKFAVK